MRYDILCGKGKECNSAEGSQRYRLVIDSYRQKYALASTRHKKCAITLEIYDLLAKTHSRFLKYNEKMKAWEELPFMQARDKIGHALRFANRRGRPGAPSGAKPATVGSATISFDRMGSSDAFMQADKKNATHCHTMTSIFVNQVRDMYKQRKMDSSVRAQLRPQLGDDSTTGQLLQMLLKQGRPVASQANSKPAAVVPAVPVSAPSLMAQHLYGELARDRQLDLEPNAILPSNGDLKNNVKPTVESSALLEEAKQHLILAFDQSATSNQSMNTAPDLTIRNVTPTSDGQDEDEWCCDSIGTIDDDGFGWDADEDLSDACTLTNVV